jgi:hypothetical protein
MTNLAVQETPSLYKNMIKELFGIATPIKKWVVLNYETKLKRNERNETKYYETQRNIPK